MYLYLTIIMLFNACNISTQTDTKTNIIGKWSYTKLITKNNITKFNKGSDLIFSSEESGYFIRQQKDSISYKYKSDDSTIIFELTDINSELFFSKERKFDFEIINEGEYQTLILKSKFTNERYIFVSQSIKTIR